VAAAMEVNGLTDEEVALVKGFVQLLRERHARPAPADEERECERGHLPAASFADDWENDQDAAYDHWRERYGVPET